jgi:hypothetical protein
MAIILGILAILLPLLAACLIWKYFDNFCDRNDETYMNSLGYFLKKLSASIVIAFIVLWIGMGIVFS